MQPSPFSAGTAFMLMQTSWIQASRQVTRRLVWDPTCLPHSLSFPVKIKQNLKVLKSRRQYNLVLENYQAFKGLTLCKLSKCFWFHSSKFCKNSSSTSKLFHMNNLESQTIWISDEAPHFVGPHLDPNCLQRTSTVFKICCQLANH